MKNVIIGDVHGCYNELLELLEKANFKLGVDRLISVGDLTDRGPNSFEVVKYMHDIDAVVVMGNHDEKYVRFHKHEMKKQQDPKYKNPMRFGLEKVAVYTELAASGLIDWMAAFPPMLVMEGGHLVVHAGFESGVPVQHQDPKRVIRVRYIHTETGKMMPITEDLRQPENSVFWTDRWNGPGNVYFGHSVLDKENVVQSIGVHGNTFALDTGCVYGGRLTAAILHTDDPFPLPQFVQVNAHEQYAQQFEEE